MIGFLAFRFGVAGVYFAILTIAFAEFARIGFDHWRWVGGSAGFFLPGRQLHPQRHPEPARQPRRMFYYLMLAMTVAAFLLCHVLLRSRAGYYWQAIRESPEAAQALGIDTFRYKMYAVVLSAAMTSLGGVLFAFYYNNLFPEQVFHISRSIELILGPIIGGIGTLFGPIVGAFLLTGLAETLREVMLRLRHRHARRQAGVLRRLPAARGDVAARRRLAAAEQALGLIAHPARTTRAEMTALLELDGVSKSFSGLRAVQDVSFAVPEGEIVGADRPQRRRQDHLLQRHRRRLPPRCRRGALRRPAHRRLAPDQICRAGVGRTFQLVKPFAGLTSMENVIVGALNACAGVARGQREGRRRSSSSWVSPPSATSWRPR